MPAPRHRLATSLLAISLLSAPWPASVVPVAVALRAAPQSGGVSQAATGSQAGAGRRTTPPPQQRGASGQAAPPRRQTADKTTASIQAGDFTVTLAPASIRVGELLMLTWTTTAPALADASVRVFDRSIPAFQIAPGTWRALIGIDLDQRPGRYTAAVLGNAGAGVLRGDVAFDVTRRVFTERRLQVAPDFVDPPAGMLDRIARERALTNAAYESSAPERLWSEPFVRPVPHQANSRFGTRSIYNGQRRSPHAGTDFLSPEKTPVHAPNSGRIVVARDLYFTGNTVIIDHGLGVLSLLAHLSRLDVAEGARVERDQVVGLVGATGRVTGPHLHWALAMSGARVDPLALLELLGDRR